MASGDKLLGGPQAGLLLGRSELVDRMLKHPLARAVRADKLTLAALGATLDLYLTNAVTALPVWDMLATTQATLESRARAWQARLKTRGVIAELASAFSEVGGGSLPGQRLPTTALILPARRGGAAALLARLRAQQPPVVGRIENDRVLLDPRTVLPDEDEALLDAVVAACT